MNDENAAGLLEGLLGGVEGGYKFREGINDRRRKNRLSDELLTLRQLEERRLGQQAETEKTRTDAAVKQAQSAQAERDRVTRLRTEVGNYLAAPKHFHSLGNYLEDKNGERQAPPLSADATTAQQVGHALGRLSGRPVSDEDALVMGSGMIPSSTINAMRPRTGLGGRGTGRGGRITEQQAFQQIDNIYGMWRAGERVGHRLTPAQRADLAGKLVNGTATERDFPDIPGEDRGNAPAGGAAKPAQSGASIWQRIKGFFGGGDPAAPQAPAQGNEQAVAPVDDHFKEARAILHDPRYAQLSDDELRAALQEAGYDDDEIDEVLAGGSEAP